MKTLLVITVVLIVLGVQTAFNGLDGGLIYKMLLYVCGIVSGFVIETIAEDNS
jgi:hypothetical protein